MLDFVIFAVTVVITLVIAVIYLYPGSKRVTTIPGPDISDPLEGNLADITAAGSLHEFLLDLHERYGEIAHYWMGPQLIVSIASPKLFKEHSQVFDRPPELYAVFESVVGPQSIMLSNGGEARSRHAAYSKCFSKEAVSKYFSLIQGNTDALARKLSSLPSEEHIPVREYMVAFAIKNYLNVAYGNDVVDEKDIIKVKKSVEFILHDMDLQVSGDKLEDNTQRYKLFTKECDNLKEIMERILEKTSKETDKLFLSSISSLKVSNDTKVADMITFLLHSFQTTGLFLTWCLYYLADNEEVLAKVLKEVKSVVGSNKMKMEHVDKLVYLKQVLNETLRCSALFPYTSRVQEFDSELAGHIVPKGTPVMHALGVSFHDPIQWTDPDKFDPERFSSENKENMPDFGFEPYGFAGKRKCIGHQLNLVESVILIADIVRKFDLTLVPGQVVVPNFGIVSSPKEEVWITVKSKK